MQKYNLTALSILTFGLCTNFSTQESSMVSGSEKPSINFFGKLSDTSGQSYSVEYITIGGMFKQIPVFSKPNKLELDPSDNTSKLDLSEIISIEAVGDQELKFNNRSYIEIKVTSNDTQKSEHNYIIDSSKRIRCAESNEAGPIEKDISFRALVKISIDGHKKNEGSEKEEDKTKKRSNRFAFKDKIKNYFSA